jgi:hypothetical protein
MQDDDLTRRASQGTFRGNLPTVPKSGGALPAALCGLDRHSSLGNAGGTVPLRGSCQSTRTVGKGVAEVKGSTRSRDPRCTHR